MKPHELNTLALWLPMNAEGLLIKVYKEGYPYKQNGIILRSNTLGPVIRYAKNYTKGKKQFSLCIITQENDTEKIEKWLDAQAKKIKDIEPKFKLLDIHYEKN